MKFTCESCSAQYMISDEKVGPSGVKVRCKKCGNVILVRRTEPAAAAAVGAAEPQAPASAAPAPGLDAELGAAFDQAFGDTPPSTAAPAAGKDLAATQAMGTEDAAKISTAAAPAQTEWYVAIGQAQVGPLPLAEVKRKWEAGDVGPDSLVWRPGMGDWAPLTTLPDLAGYLAPIPRAAPRKAAEPAPAPASRKEPEAPAAGPAAPAADPTWKPVGASALAALANEELANRSAPAQRPSPRPAPGGVKSLVDALPDGGGVDPTGALPLSIKALERTDEKRIEPRTSVARGAAQARSRRSASRALGIFATLVVAGGAAAGGFLYWQRTQQGPAGAEGAASAPPAPAATPAPAPAPPAVAAAPEPPPPAQPEPTPAPAPEPKAEPKPERTPPAAARAAKPPPPPRETKRETRTAAATPSPAPAKKGGSLLDFESNDAALDAALGGGSTPSGRSVYVPPAAGGGLPDKVSPGDINAAVAQRIDALRKCVSEQKAREPDASGTLKMRWVIQADGSVRDVRSLTPEYAQGAFAACISGVVKSIRFPRSTTAGQEVVFPFNF